MSKPLNHILCIDDEQDILQIAKLSLEVVGGFRVSLCLGSRDAVAMAESLRPDLILLDVMMPEMDGPTVLSRLRENAATADIPVIFMTAKIQPPEVKHYLGLGAIGVVPKPFDPMGLASHLKATWEQRGGTPAGTEEMS